jgi:CO dehydrogenase maturation factor
MPTQESSMPKASISKLLAVCGKGGVGKTALTALITKVILESDSNLKLLVIDADPAMGLPNALGVCVQRTMGEVRDQIIKTARTAKDERKIELASMIDYLVFEALIELDGYSLIAMGRSEAEGCFCSVNDLLRASIEELSKNFDVVVIDGEAGLEQINRKVMRNTGTLITVTDLSARGFQVAATIKSIAQNPRLIGCEKIGLVVNRVREGQEQQIRQSAQKIGLEPLGCIPEDESIASFDSMGKSILELDDTSPSVAAAREIVYKLQLLPQPPIIRT